MAQRVEEGDDERERLELQLETTMQLSEMALAASVKAGEEEQQQEASQRTTEEAGDAEAMVIIFVIGRLSVVADLFA